ncbi:ABC-2 type transport system ATP-binding protein [Weissella uvarum]|uniref:ABC transporter ATP-binding protein n=1 Tax=Weissella uvarum TaxID=1479233 RepID=UPI0019605AD9|nr:ABC transporter ATP-binding protein [Weissella uvarum]MBM7618088.1 ABC-2 type transport system ATP-binding protein [Weissella uvarum]MCM0595925.1 ABC transporter ATP-binding protein [Weissella uvarum]
MIELTNLTKQFGDKTAVQSLNMQVQPGEVMGLIGQNGAGKTTTFRMILDFIQPTEGTVRWNEEPIDSQKRQKLGFLPEERGLYQKETVENQVLYFAELHGMKRVDARIALQDWMKRLNVVGKMSDKVQSLSKGNAQKIQLIATVIFQPDFLILDEPFSGLDPVNTELMMEEILNLKAQGAMIIFSSHNMAGVEKLSDQITMLRHGETVLQGRPSEIRNQFGRTNIYLEAPVSDEALLAIPGVEKLEQQGAGRHLQLRDEQAGRQVFEVATADGYIPVFAQEPPTLDAIFREEVAAGERQ